MGAALVIVLVGLGALAAGILVGRYYVPDDRHLKRTARASRAYMRALNHLIARDHDTVIDELRRVLEDNVDDAEPYFALGALFRSRGEHERAIRVHQALAVREGGTKRLRLRARYELGLDFRAAGMPRRATRAMEDCLVEDPKHEGALRALCGLYEEQGRYAEAAAVWQRLSRLRGQERTIREHHLLAAAAQKAIGNADLDGAKRLLRDARKIAETPHFYASAAELAAARGKPDAASARIQQALALAPDLARYLVPGLVEAERQLASRSLPRADAGDVARELDAELAEAPAPRPPPDDPDEDEDDDEPAITVTKTATAGVAVTGAASVTGAGANADAAAVAVVTALAPAGPTAPVPVPAPASPVQPGTGEPLRVTDLDRVAAERAAAALRDVLARTGPDPHLALALAELEAAFDPTRALAEYRALAARFPDVLPARVAAARLALATADAAAIAAELTALAGPGGALTWAFEGAWRCGQCGRRSAPFFWRCGQCRRWGAARLDIGRDALEVPKAPPRERREAPRPSITQTLLGAAATEALPAPTLDHGLSEAELARAGARRSVLGKIGGWFSGAWSGRRGRAK